MRFEFKFMIQSILGKKLGQLQGFLENGARIPMTRIWVKGNVVSQIKTIEKEGYEAIQLGFGDTKKANKPSRGHAKKSGLKLTPHFYRETKADKIEDHEIGDVIKASEVFKPGDVINVTGISKGKGFAGGVKRYHFRGGPRTHGQSDRHRAPGSIGQSTTPGRVYKGKRMAGRMGNAQVTVKNLEVIEFHDGEILVKGLIPGPIGTIVTLTRRGANKKPMGLYKEPVIEEVVIDEKNVEEIGTSVEEQEEMRKIAEAKADLEEKEEAVALQNINQDTESNSVSKDLDDRASNVSGSDTAEKVEEISEESQGKEKIETKSDETEAEIEANTKDSTETVEDAKDKSKNEPKEDK